MLERFVAITALTLASLAAMSCTFPANIWCSRAHLCSASNAEQVGFHLNDDDRAKDGIIAAVIFICLLGSSQIWFVELPSIVENEYQANRGASREG